MYPHSSKLGVSNSRAKPQIVAVEPWANDYTLLPGEELEIVAFGDTAVPWFHVVEWDGTSQVYCNETADFAVRQNGVELQCGHNRSPTARLANWWSGPAATLLLLENQSAPPTQRQSLTLVLCPRSKR